ncbi:MAG: hypothetical protein PCFJNLEI_00774 [Verrucomicrobiae bacterium]|nr:hypothetical protein [Verrucomicrobiae bacterium]
MAGLRVVVAIAFIALPAGAAPARWLFPDAPYRAVVQLEKAPTEPTAGIAITVPEFGNTTEKLLDVVLTDSAGTQLPLAHVWRGAGREVLLLAQDLRANEDYYVYFGGNRFRPTALWQPQVSLLLETRPLNEPKAITSWEQMDATWRGAAESDGAMWVNRIYHGINPFGARRHFASRYTGYLKTANLTALTLFTMSSDASFVLVNGKYEFGWPGEHGSDANVKTARKHTVPVAGPVTRIDYYHAKTAGQRPAMVLGWQKGDKLETIPATAWVQPGTTKLVRLEHVQGAPVPAPELKVRSYMGYADLWLYEVTGTLADEVPAGWTVQWKLSDGTTKEQRDFTRIAVGGSAFPVTVTLRREKEELTGVRELRFVDPLPAASVKNQAELARYVTAMLAEKLAELPAELLRGYVAFLREAEQDQALGEVATAWVRKNPDPNDALWLPAQVSRLRWLAQTDPRQAVEELRRIPPPGRTKYLGQLDLLELELMVFLLNDPAVVARAQTISMREAKSVTGRLALVRAGDYYRLQGRYPEAVAQYQQAQRNAPDGADARKLPAQDRAYSITINNLLERGETKVAEEKLTEWEAKHPVAKLGSDFLILRGRVLLELGRWREALAEIESFAKLQAESPFMIDADFYRARVLFELGRKDEARKIWLTIVEKYPQHALVAQSRQWAEKQ